MKLWIIGLAISAVSGCGHEQRTEENTTQDLTHTSPPIPAQPPMNSPMQDSTVFTVDTVGRPQGAPGLPPDPKKPPPVHVEKRGPLPKPVPVDFMK